MNPGDTLLEFDFGNHLWMVVSVDIGPDIALVSLTTLRPDSDRTTILRQGDHPYIQHESCVDYRRAVMTPVEPLRAAKADQRPPQHAPLSPELLLRVQEGGLASRGTPRVVKTAIRFTLGV